ESDICEIHRFRLPDKAGACGTAPDEEKMNLWMGDFEEFRGVENVVNAMSQAESASPEGNLLPGEIQLREELLVGRAGAKRIRIGAIRKKKNFFRGNIFLFLQNFDDPVSDRIDVSCTPVAPAHDGGENFHDGAVFHEALIDNNVRPQIGDVEDELRTPEDGHQPRGEAEEERRRFYENVVGTLAPEKTEDRRERK